MTHRKAFQATLIVCANWLMTFYDAMNLFWITITGNRLESQTHNQLWSNKCDFILNCQSSQMNVRNEKIALFFIYNQKSRLKLRSHGTY